MYRQLMKKLQKKEEGFTLVELLIVVAIIAILAAIAIPQFGKYRIRAYATEVNSDLKNAYTAATSYLVDNPTATVSYANLIASGYKASPNINISGITSNLTMSAGHINIPTNVSGLTTSIGRVTYQGVYTQAVP